MAKGKTTLKQPPADKSSRITPDGKEVSTDEFPPVFALRTSKGWAVCDCEKHEKAALADKLHELSQLTWAVLDTGDRTSGQGTEKIPRKSIQAGIPSFVTKDVEKFLVVRCNKQFRMVGFRSRQIFNIVWLDRNHELY